MQLQTFAIFGAVVAPIVFAVVGAAQALIRRRMHDRAWYTATIRLLAVAVGAAIGAAIHADLDVPSLRLGVMLGAGAGALSAWIVRALKAKIAAASSPTSPAIDPDRDSDDDDGES
jgi:predicted hotdog family 3-hydroxylacyl-ACP dehydratase